MKKLVACILTLCILFSLLPSANALSPSASRIETGNKLSDVFTAELYVKADKTSGLSSDIKVSFSLTVLDCTLYLPGCVEPSGLFFSWDDTDLTVKQGETFYTSGHAPVAADGETVTYTLSKGLVSAVANITTMVGAEGVSPMFLNLDESLGTIDAMNEDENHETSCYGAVYFDGVQNYISMKGRGNSTWGFAKKPYNLTFYKKADYDKKKNVELIKGVEAKKWSLLANYMDDSLLRNKTALDLSNELGIGLDSRFVDLWMNGEYLGLYLLTPKNDYQAPDNGYILENDNYLSTDDPQFLIEDMKEVGILDFLYNRITIKDIGDGAAKSGETPETIEAWFSEAWTALRDYNSANYRNYFDVDSWAKMYLMYEFTKTYDVFSGSLLMHRDGTGKDDLLYAGPAWDYEISFGRTVPKVGSGVSLTNQLTAQGWYIDSIGLLVETQPVSILQEFGKHSDFMTRVYEIYSQNQKAFDSISSNVIKDAALIEASAMMNTDLWGLYHLNTCRVLVPLTLGTGKYQLHYQVTDTWEAFVNNFCEYTEKRALFFSDNLKSFAVKSVSSSPLLNSLNQKPGVLSSVKRCMGIFGR